MKANPLVAVQAQKGIIEWREKTCIIGGIHISAQATFEQENDSVRSHSYGRAMLCELAEDIGKEAFEKIEAQNKQKEAIGEVRQMLNDERVTTKKRAVDALGKRQAGEELGLALPKKPAEMEKWMVESLLLHAAAFAQCSASALCICTRG